MSHASVLQSCQKDPCTKDTLDALVSNVTTGCASELSATPVTLDLLPTIQKYVWDYYDFARQLVCLQEYVLPSVPFVYCANSSMSSSNTSKFCMVEILSSVESYLGKPFNVHTLDTAASLYDAPRGTIPKNLTVCVRRTISFTRTWTRTAGDRGTTTLV